jgi:hypothetical protein
MHAMKTNLARLLPRIKVDRRTPRAQDGGHAATKQKRGWPAVALSAIRGARARLRRIKRRRIEINSGWESGAGGRVMALWLVVFCSLWLLVWAATKTPGLSASANEACLGVGWLGAIGWTALCNRYGSLWVGPESCRRRSRIREKKRARRSRLRAEKEQARARSEPPSA